MSDRWKIRDIQKLEKRLERIESHDTGVSDGSNPSVSGGGYLGGAGNLFDNAGFEIAQKGTTHTTTVTPPAVYGADRWVTEAVNNAKTSAVTMKVDVTSTDGEDNYYVIGADGFDTGYQTIGQCLDPGKNLIGKELTVSMEVRIPSVGSHPSAIPATLKMYTRPDSLYLRDGTSYKLADGKYMTEDVWYKVTTTFIVPTYTDYLHVGLGLTGIGAYGSGDTLHIRRPQLMVGSSTPTYSKQPRAQEEYKCYEFYYATESTTAAAGGVLARYRGDVTSGGGYSEQVVFPRRMYSIPIITDLNTWSYRMSTVVWESIMRESAELLGTADSTGTNGHFSRTFTANAEHT